jgi:hypothetical protein
MQKNRIFSVNRIGVRVLSAQENKNKDAFSGNQINYDR